MKKVILIIAAAIAIVSISSCNKQTAQGPSLAGTKWEATATPEGKTITLKLNFTSDKEVIFSVLSNMAVCNYEYKDPNIRIMPPFSGEEDMVGTVKGNEMDLSTKTEHYVFKKK